MSAQLAQQMEETARAAGLQVTDAAAGADFNGAPTLRFTLSLDGESDGKSTTVELSEGFNFQSEALRAPVAAYLAETAKRLKNPQPDVYLTLHELPLKFERFAWPFHVSTSGADTSLVHGEVWLMDGHDSPLHAKIAASATLTFREALPAMEQPYAESAIYNAVRKTMDQGQLELVRSGNRQPVPVTTRYYSLRQQRFTFNDTNEQQRQDFLAAKIFWLSGVLGEGRPVWVADPRDAQYLNSTEVELKQTAQYLVAEGLLRLDAEGIYATPTAGLMGLRRQYEDQLASALEFTRPKFNEDMRAGHTNM
ncbi:MAG TPA: hypothetical protein VNU94_05640 [Acidobacteriaceae bacterium]|nr:hypothetical protein [Acidobacteriaceae bacterium]